MRFGPVWRNESESALEELDEDDGVVFLFSARWSLGDGDGDAFSGGGLFFFHVGLS